MKRRLLAAYRALFSPEPKPTKQREHIPPREVLDAAAIALARDEVNRTDAYERAAEWVEARAIAGAGPWLNAEQQHQLARPLALREAPNPLLSQGAYGDIELALQNVEWRREVNLSWIEFSRWGIQQIILISRLYYIKNPIARRLIDVCAAYVFARGVEVSSPDEAANDTLKEFFVENATTLGQSALVAMERSKDTDGNLFFAFFSDRLSTGKVKVRTFDAVEIAEIITNPDDVDDPWFYRRVFTLRNFDVATGASTTQSDEAWYPALGYEPATRPESIGGKPVYWDVPVYHRKVGAVAKWHFGCPRIYPLLDWSRAATRYLEACATTQKALAQIAMSLTMKGGQQAIEGAKQQLETTVNSQANILDHNPPPVNAAIWASGPGTKLEAFKTSGAGQDPEKVRQYKLMCCMVKGVPETFLADVSTGNLATATSLDRPTETMFLELQEQWVEDLTVIAQYVLNVSGRAAGGRLRESLRGRNARIMPMDRRKRADGRWEWVPMTEAERDRTGAIEVRVQFPEIREGDIPARVSAIVAAMTLDNKGGQVVGIDQKEGVRMLFDAIGCDKTDEIVEEMFPETEYDPDRTDQDVPAPVAHLVPKPGGSPQQVGNETVAPADHAVIESARALLAEAKAMNGRR